MFQRAGTTQKGLDLERDMFGYDNTSLPKPKYISWLNALEDVMLRQEGLGWNPLFPRTALGTIFFGRVKEQLPEDLRGKLLLYSAVGTSFDYWHGVDGFFVLGPALLTFDLSRKKKTEVKAHVLITLPMLVETPSSVARMIATRLIERYDDAIREIHK